MKTDLEIIDEAIELISKDGGWTQGAFCRTDDGTPGSLGSGTSASFCIEGALIEAATRGKWGVDFTTSWDEAAHLGKRLGGLMAGVEPDDAIEMVHLPREFNDGVAQSQEDAILWLKTARERLIDESR